MDGEPARLSLGLTMEHLILLAGFAGAWLLVAGPIRQAVIELSEEDFERERLRAPMAQLSPPDPVSSWWWLVPPMRLYLGRRRRERWKDQLVMSLPDDDYEALTSYMSKTRAWLLVGAGGFLIATKETWELVEGWEWPTWRFWVLVGAMLLLSVGSAVVQSARHDREAQRRARTAQADG